MVKIVFWDNCLNERGTTLAIYDYAYYNKTILGNESIIMYNTTRNDNLQDVIDKFKNEFKVIGVNNFKLVDPILYKLKCNIFYIIKSGENEGQMIGMLSRLINQYYDGRVRSDIFPKQYIEECL